MKTEMVSYCFIKLCVKKLWYTYILQKGSDKMNELYHHGIKGQKWGVQRYQNPDDSSFEWYAINGKNFLDIYL